MGGSKRPISPITPVRIPVSPIPTVSSLIMISASSSRLPLSSRGRWWWRRYQPVPEITFTPV